MEVVNYLYLKRLELTKYLKAIKKRNLLIHDYKDIKHVQSGLCASGFYTILKQYNVSSI
jgi:hypothetical protein